jgi:hypothetical protein
MAGLYKVSRRAMGESKVPDDQLDDTLAELAAAGLPLLPGRCHVRPQPREAHAAEDRADREGDPLGPSEGR